MKLTLALLADYANVSREGTLNVLGIFDTISAATFPAAHPELRLVMRFEAAAGEQGAEKGVEIKLLDADGEQLLSLSGRMAIPAEGNTLTYRLQQILTLNNLVLPRPGMYRFDILINGQTQDISMPFEVIALEPAGEIGRIPEVSSDGG